MKTRKLRDLEISEMGLGCMGMSEFYGTTNEAEATKTIHTALDNGITFLDTADMYGPFTNEKLVGSAIKDRRGDVVLATKFGNERSADGGFLGVNGRPEYVRSACDDSLTRLGVDYIDLYYQHRVDPDVAIEETWGAMAELVEAGKVRNLGISEPSIDSLRRAHAVHPITALQNEYSLWTRDPEDGILDVARELGIGFVAYSPMGRGFLTGTIKTQDELKSDFMRTSPRFQDENLKKNVELLEKIEEIANEKDCTAGQLAIAWVMAQGDDIVPIPGTKRVNYLLQNIAAVDIDLTEEDLKHLNKAFPKGAASGDRYANMSTVNR